MRQQERRVALERHALLLRDIFKPRRDDLARNPPEIEPLTPRQYRRRYFLELGRRKNEYHVRRRLLERLQKRVERALRQHVDLVYDVDLVFQLRRKVFYVVAYFSDVVDAVVARGVHLDDIDAASRLGAAAGRALAARVPVDRVLAVDRPRENLRAGRLACSPCSAEKISVGSLPLRDLIPEY